MRLVLTSTAVAAMALTTFSSSSFCDAFTPIIQRRSMNTGKIGSALFSATVSTDAPADTSVFLSAESAKACIDLAGSPVFAYSLEKLQDSADACLQFPNAYGLTVRYAMKASPNSAILKFFNSKGIHIDASSGFEVKRAVSAGIPPENISLSTQELPDNFADLIKMGVNINACSVSQVERIGKAFAGTGQKNWYPGQSWNRFWWILVINIRFF
mmetsp:Transcript_42306/g.47271  ORF Transcript_42306/g.47271 Transcript_42306/m.47271 type:complete len:213 (+) Transcript_42306:131-769(+)